jgi:hypothetical protein
VGQRSMREKNVKAEERPGAPDEPVSLDPNAEPAPVDMENFARKTGEIITRAIASRKPTRK